ncbi:MAG: MFS transporter [Thermomicrobiales bacterium]
MLLVTFDLLLRATERVRSGIALATIPILWGVPILLLAFVRDLPLVLILYGLAGWVWAPYKAVSDTLLQRLIPKNLRGRIFGISAATTSAAGPLGAGAGGILLDHFRVVTVIGVCAITCMLTGIIGLLSATLRSLGTAREVQSAVESRAIGESYLYVGGARAEEQ